LVKIVILERSNYQFYIQYMDEDFKDGEELVDEDETLEDEDGDDDDDMGDDDN